MVLELLPFVVFILVLAGSNAVTAYFGNKRIEEEGKKYVDQLHEYYSLKRRFDEILAVPGVQEALVAEVDNYHENHRKLTTQIDDITADYALMSLQEEELHAKMRANHEKLKVAMAARSSLEGRRKYVKETVFNPEGRQ